MQSILFFVSKTVPAILSPITLLLLAFPFAFFRRKGRLFSPLRIIAFTVWILVASLSIPLISDALAIAWEEPLADPSTLFRGKPYDAIIVLGGMVMPEASYGWHIEEGSSAERLTAAARLYREGYAETILVTGGTGSLLTLEKTEAELMVQLLSLMGVPESAILTESKSRNTFENAVFSKEVAVKNAINRTVLVTSAIHMKRSTAIFKKAGWNFVPFPVDTLHSPKGFPANILPDAECLAVSLRVLREIAGYAAYAALGRL